MLLLMFATGRGDYPFRVLTQSGLILKRLMPDKRVKITTILESINFGIYFRNQDGCQRSKMAAIPH